MSIKKFFSNLISWKWWLNLDAPVWELPKLSLTITITAHNEGLWVAETIESVLRQTYNAVVPIKLVVVDDGSTDDTGAIADRYVDRGVVVIHHDEPSGRKAYAANSGLEITDTELFLALDADAILNDDAIEKMMYHFANPETAMVTGTVRARYANTWIERARTAEYINAFTVLKPAQNRVFGVMIASGCFSIVRTKLLKEVGGYSGRTLGEDLDLTLMFHERKWKIRFCNNAICTVVDPNTYKDFDNQVTRWSHSYVQNFRIRGWNLFKPRFSLGVFMYSYLIWQIVGPFFLPILFITAFKSVPISIISFLAMWLVVIWIPIAIGAIHQGISLKIVLKTIVPMFFVQYANVWILFRVLVKELVLKTSEVKWQKGHA